MDTRLLVAIETELSAEKPVMLATIVARTGSAPRGIGTAMSVSIDGEQTGTVGGGSLEYRVRQDALSLLQTGKCAVKQYEIHTDEKSVYSGAVTILFRPFAGESGRELLHDMTRALETGQEAYLVCQMLDSCALESVVLSAQALRQRCNLASAPEEPLLTQGENIWIVEPVLPLPRVILLGGGHVAQCMARQLALLDYRIWVVEDRVEFASTALFPMAERVVCSDYALAEPLLNVTKRDHAIVMSRGHETDVQILRWLLRSPADYIGCIGSKKKIALSKERLLTDGLTQEQISRLHAPVGLAIGAQTPAEIAVSVAAEMIQYLSRINGKS